MALEDLVETLLRWSVEKMSTAEVVSDATQLVAEGSVAEWVVALACLPPDASATDVEDALGRAIPEIDVPVVPRGNPEAVLAAALAMVRRCLMGHVAERDLARWMHTVIGHARSEELEPLVVLDDVYDSARYTSDSTASVDARVRAEAERLAHLHPHA